MATYTGPEVSPTFVTGVINDSWDKAQSLTTDAREAVQDLSPEALLPLDTSQVQADVAVDVSAPGLQQVNLDPADALEDELTRLLRDFMGRHFPALEIPDAAERWRDIAASFDGDPLRLAAARMRARIATDLTGRGLAVPAEVLEIQRAGHDREYTRLETQRARNTDILWKTHRKSVDLTKWEVAMRAYLDALEAARAFLLGCVLAAAGQVAEEAARIARYREQLQATYFRHLNTMFEASGNDLEQALLEKRIRLDADLAGEERKAFVFGQRVAAALQELEGIASQATAAINRMSADASVTGIERTP